MGENQRGSTCVTPSWLPQSLCSATPHRHEGCVQEILPAQPGSKPCRAVPGWQRRACGAAMARQAWCMRHDLLLWGKRQNIPSKLARALPPMSFEGRDEIPSTDTVQKRCKTQWKGGKFFLVQAPGEDGARAALGWQSQEKRGRAQDSLMSPYRLCGSGVFGRFDIFGVFGRVGVWDRGVGQWRCQAWMGCGSSCATKAAQRQHRESCQEFQPQISAQIKGLLVWELLSCPNLPMVESWSLGRSVGTCPGPLGLSLWFYSGIYFILDHFVLFAALWEFFPLNLIFLCESQRQNWNQAQQSRLPSGYCTGLCHSQHLCIE